MLVLVSGCGTGTRIQPVLIARFCLARLGSLSSTIIVSLFALIIDFDPACFRSPYICGAMFLGMAWLAVANSVDLLPGPGTRGSQWGRAGKDSNSVTAIPRDNGDHDRSPETDNKVGHEGRILLMTLRCTSSWMGWAGARSRGNPIVYTTWCYYQTRSLVVNTIHVHLTPRRHPSDLHDKCLSRLG